MSYGFKKISNPAEQVVLKSEDRVPGMQARVSWLLSNECDRNLLVQGHQLCRGLEVRKHMSPAEWWARDQPPDVTLYWLTLIESAAVDKT